MEKTIKILVVLIVFAVGFYLGRLTIETKEKIVYKQGKTVTGQLNYFEPIELEGNLEDVPKIFWKTDTIIKENTIYLKQEIDTVKILADFLIKREYDFNVFDDENGTLDIKQTIQFNQLQDFNYTFTPIHKEIIRPKERVFEPFASVSYSTLNYFGVGGGCFYHNLGLEYNYWTNKTHSLGIKYKW